MTTGRRPLEMLEEAIEVIRALWTGDVTNHHGRYYTVEQARLYSLPDSPPPILVAARGERAIEIAARNDGLVGTVPDPQLIERFERAGGAGKSRLGMLHVCWAKTEEEARRTAREWWPNSALPGELSVELPLPRHFEQAAEMLDESDVADGLTCGPDPEKHFEVSGSTPMLGSTTCTCIRSGQTSRASSASLSVRSCCDSPADGHVELMTRYPAWLYHRNSGEIDDVFWELLSGVVDHVERRWEEPDRGIWEVRGEPQQFVSSKIMAWVAVDRAIRLARPLPRGRPESMDRPAETNPGAGRG